MKCNCSDGKVSIVRIKTGVPSKVPRFHPPSPLPSNCPDRADRDEARDHEKGAGDEEAGVEGGLGEADLLLLVLRLVSLEQEMVAAAQRGWIEGEICSGDNLESANHVHRLFRAERTSS